MRRKLSALLGTFLFSLGVVSSASGNPAEQEISGAFKEFHAGRARPAIDKLTSLAVATEDPKASTRLKMAILDMCTVAFFSKCVGELAAEVANQLKTNPDLKIFSPELVFYLTRNALWNGHNAFISEQIKRGPLSFVNPSQHTTLYARYQLSLHSHYLGLNDLRSAEKTIPAAIIGLLAADPKNIYTISQTLLELIDSLYAAQNITAAAALSDRVEPFLATYAPANRYIYADYLMLSGRLLSHTNAYSIAAGKLRDAEHVYGTLDMDGEQKIYKMSIANSLASAAYVLGGNGDFAEQTHSEHPLFALKEDIIASGGFRLASEYYFAVSDLFIATALSKRLDQRWKPLFDRATAWNVGPIERVIMSSYRNFALGLLLLDSGEKLQGQTLLIEAAKQRVNSFASILNKSSDAFQLPSFVDRIIITVGLNAYIKGAFSDNPDFVLQASEVLGRNLRHRLVDAAALISSQHDRVAQRAAQTFVHLSKVKQEWELDRIGDLLYSPSSRAKTGTVVGEYADAIDAHEAAKERLLSNLAGQHSAGLPTISELQERLGQQEAFVTYFPLFGTEFGKVCVTKGSVEVRTDYYDPHTIEHVRRLKNAVSTAGQSPISINMYPAESAVRVYHLLFDGLDPCLREGIHLSVALPSEFVGISLGALLTAEPARSWAGFDLRNAEWLIKKYSFSVVVSSRHLLASMENVRRLNASRRLLGVGAPRLAGASTNAEQSLRGIARERYGIDKFSELPEAADELRYVGDLVAPNSADLLIGDEATEEKFRASALSEYDVIHFATHGISKDDISGLSEAALVLTPSDSEDPYDDGLLTASEISRLSLNSRLVVLSACNTAQYDVAQFSRGITDLQSAFTVAGVPALLATLWPVDSIAAKEIVSRFFERWRQTPRVSASQALSIAIREYLSDGEYSNQHPRYWAAFLLVGNGGIVGPGNLDSASSDRLKMLSEYRDGGEIVDAAPIGPDIVLGLTAEWDGKRQNQIISRRNHRMEELWRIDSRSVGILGIATANSKIFVAGYSIEEQPIPIVSAFDSKGKKLWDKKFVGLRGYSITSIAAERGRIWATAVRTTTDKESTDYGTVVLLDATGKQISARNLVSVEGKDRSGVEATSVVTNGRLTIGVGFGGSRSPKSFELNSLGFPWPCFKSSFSEIIELDGDTLDVVSTSVIERFKIAALTTFSDVLFAGGIVDESCNRTNVGAGTAGVVRLDSGGVSRYVWQDAENFISGVRGLVAVENGLVIVSGYERRIGIRRSRTFDEIMATVVGDKRWGDDLSSSRGATVVHLSSKGDVSSKRDLSFGLSIFIRGMEVIGKQRLLYGSVGGVPAVSLE